MVLRYVNTASTAGSQDGTTSTAGNSGTAAYESLSKWNTAEAADITATGSSPYPDTHTVICSGTAADTVGNFNISGWTTDATYFITIQGETSSGTYDTSLYRMEYSVSGNYRQCFRLQEAYTVIEDIQIQRTSSSLAAKGIRINADECPVSRSIFRGILTGNQSNCQGLDISTTNSGDVMACLFIDWNGTGSNTSGLNLTSSGTVAFAYNNTFHNCALGYRKGYNDATSRNNLAQNCTDGFFNTTGWASPTTHNCSDITSDAPGTSSQTGNVVFTDEANDDFELSASDTVAKGNGFDLSGTFDFDLTNTAMPAAWPIGCLQEAVAASGARPQGPFGHVFHGPFGGPI